MFGKNDLYQFENKGISLDKANTQIVNFKNGFPFIKLQSAATIGNGLVETTINEAEEFIIYFQEYAKNHKVLKFVPASGAASRMFKDLYEFNSKLKNGENLEALLEDKDHKNVKIFFKSLESFAFFHKLADIIFKDGKSIESLLQSKNYELILDYFLGENGLNYGNLPKGLLFFHSYLDGSRLAIEEHLLEGIEYACDAQGCVRLHFTVSQEHKNLFLAAFEKLIPKYQAKFNVKFEINYSIQKPSTDTMAVDLNNNPFRLKDGTILLRPGGHGVLIENLNELDADIIFIKNIDNIVIDKFKSHTYFYKKVIGGMLAKIMNDTFDFLDKLDCADVTDDDLLEMKKYLESDMQQIVSSDFDAFNRMEKIDFLYNIFNRPIRVCGMVKNEGEPGGGPFRVEKDSDLSLQIVEGSQIDFEDLRQSEIVKNSTHFNPVDLACSIKDFRGEKFNLLDFVDAQTGFISIKSKDGRDLKAQELPGLWNGAMADWNTIFVEVPIITFNPVKTINDLLREGHLNA